MRTKLFLLTLCSAFILYACNKDGMTDFSTYENLLNSDYKNALKNHESLQTGTVSVADHNAHHSGTSTSTQFDRAYFEKMFGESDSLFSQHFYEFCRDLAGSGVMTGSSGMNGMGMMREGMMDHHFDADEMMEYLDDIHSQSTGHMEMDSLMYEQMEECNMMNSRTGNIKSIFSNMQRLRKEHMLLH